jgi:hypothetical protein
MLARPPIGLSPTGTGSHWRVERWFSISVALFMILLSAAGFGPSLVDQSRRNAAPTLLVIAHGVVTGAWLLLFLTQATLAATGRTAVHRRLGVLGVVLAGLVIVLGYFTVVDLTRRGHDLSGDLTNAATSPPTAEGILPPLAGLMIFGVLVAAGWWYRRRPEIHKRLMLLALLNLAPVPFLHLGGHLSGYWSGFQLVFLIVGQTIATLLLFAVAVHDKVAHGRIHPVSLWVPIGLIAALVVMNVVVMPSPVWHDVATWLVG